MQASIFLCGEVTGSRTPSNGPYEVTLGTCTMVYRRDQDAGQVHDGVPIRSLGR
jgi:hypothetical protein